MTDTLVGLSEELALVERIKQLRAERKHYFDVEGDGVDTLLCDIQGYFNRSTITKAAGADQ
jgi:hypothetical protein